MADILLFILFVAFLLYLLYPEQRLTLPVIEIRTGPQGTKIIIPP